LSDSLFSSFLSSLVFFDSSGPSIHCVLSMV
jgi:hypothetical protein